MPRPPFPIGVYSRAFAVKISVHLREMILSSMILFNFSGDSDGNDQSNHDAAKHPEV